MEVSFSTRLINMLSRGGEYECAEYGRIISHYMTLHIYSLLNSIHAFSIEKAYLVGTSLSQFSEGIGEYCTTFTSRYVHVRTVRRCA
jgi:hypothetical protein